MFSTSLAVAALGGMLATVAPSQPTWQADYGTARAAASQTHKPIAVFIGTGETGVEKLVKDQGLPQDVVQVLNQQYVCVYVDTATPAGKELSQSFQMNEGVVISGRDGNVQALRHAGPVAPTELNSYLVRYADPNQVVTTTQLVGAPVSYGYSPYTQPVYPQYQPQYQQPGPIMNALYGVRNFVGGGCANGRCGR